MDQYGRLRGLVRKVWKDELAENENSDAFQRGREAGRIWATGAATLDQLERLRKAFAGTVGPVYTVHGFEVSYSGFGIRQEDSPSWELISMVILGRKYDQQLYREFWSPWIDDTEISADRKVTREFTSGFANAVVRTWSWIRSTTDISDIGSVAATSTNLQVVAVPAS